MQYIGVNVASFMKLVDYVDSLGLDAETIVCDAGMSLAELSVLPADTVVSAQQYSKLYKSSVKAMQEVHPYVPWAAGLGSDAFELLCHAVVGSATLGQALDRAVKYETLLRPLSGRQLSLEKSHDTIKLIYKIDTDNVASLFAPETWQRAQSYETVAVASGLVVWHAFSSWLVGHSILLSRVNVGMPSIGNAYTASLEQVLKTDVFFNAAESFIEFDASVLDYRIVQNQESLQEFLDLAVYQLSLVEKQPSSVADAIKQLLGNDFSSGIPSFTEISERLHLSESSLRRKLLKEHTTFQLIKDEVRCDLAKQYLLDATLRMNDIAERLGFTELSSFVRSFRHWVGITPKAYRDQCLGSVELKSG